MSLYDTLKQIKEIKPIAEADADEGPRETLAGRRGRKARAIETLKDLKKTYSDELRQSAMFILVIGDKRDEVATVASNFDGCFVADPEAVFTNLVDRIPQSLYLGKETVSNMFDILGRHLEDKAIEMGIVGYPQLIYRQEYAQHLSSREDFVKLVKRAMTEQVGGELVGIQTIFDLTKKAIDKNHGNKYTPIMLPSGDTKFALTVANDLERISSKVFVLQAGTVTMPKKTSGTTVEADAKLEEVTKESVKKVLNSLKGSLRK